MSECERCEELENVPFIVHLRKSINEHLGWFWYKQYCIRYVVMRHNVFTNLSKAYPFLFVHKDDAYFILFDRERAEILLDDAVPEFENESGLFESSIYFYADNKQRYKAKRLITKVIKRRPNGYYL